MKINKRCFSVFVACLIATALVIPASAANTLEGKTETFDFSNGNCIDISNCISLPLVGPDDETKYGGWEVGFPCKIKLSGSNIKFTKATGYKNGSFNVKWVADGAFGKNRMTVKYSNDSWVINPDEYSKNNEIILKEPALYVIEIQNGDQYNKIWIQESKGVTNEIPDNWAYPTPSTVKVDGKAIPFDAYNINDNNYFKLRDIAKVLDGTGKQFNVGWDGAKNSIMIQHNKHYQAVGGELATGSKNSIYTATPTTSSVYVEDTLANFTAYNIKDNNYFKLRDIAEKLNFGVTWDGSSNTVYIDTTTGYTP